MTIYAFPNCTDPQPICITFLGTKFNQLNLLQNNFPYLGVESMKIFMFKFTKMTKAFWSSMDFFISNSETQKSQDWIRNLDTYSYIKDM